MKNNNSSNNLTNRIRSSLVIKLNFKMMGRLFFAFLKIDLLIIILGIIILLFNAETKGQKIISLIEEGAYGYMPIYFDEDYQIFKTLESKDGFELPHIVERWLPLKEYKVKRNFSIEESNNMNGLFNKLSYLKYTMEVSFEDSIYTISYSLGKGLVSFVYLYLIVLGFELLILLGNIRKGSKSIRKALKPLAELTEATKSLQKAVSSNVNDKEYIRDLAGKISNIDANKLDKKITVDSSQEELKELALAINHMLNRINSSYKAQVRFVSDASHELRTPISVIQGYVNLLDRWGKKDPNVMQEAIDAIKSESENMKNLIEQLLFLARSDNETIKLQKEIIDVCNVVEEIIHETRMIDVNHQFEVKLNRPAFIEADKQLIKQALRILVDNSIKFTPYGKKIILRVNKANGEVRIEVQDNGIGIEPEDLPNIFNRFYRSDESRARDTGGAGLGLSIAKWIVDRHGAYFEIISRVNIGTRITIVFQEAKNQHIKEEK